MASGNGEEGYFRQCVGSRVLTLSVVACRLPTPNEVSAN